MRAPRHLLFLVLAAPAWAADPTPPPTDSIAAAKADLAAIRSPQAQSESSAVLPSLDMKDISAGPTVTSPDLGAILAAPEAELGPDGLKKKKEGTGNWLVDAMDKDAAERKSERSGTSRSKERDDLLKGDTDPLKDGARPGKDALAGDESREKAPGEAAPAAYNPLDSFMSSWVSAKDHDLLLPSSKTDGLSGSGARAGSDGGGSLELGPSGPQTDAPVPGMDAAALGDLRQMPNPYLAELDAPAIAQPRSFSPAEIPPFEPADTIDPIRPSAVGGVDTKPTDPSHSFIPDFAQPSDDDKYFKQMKRF